MAAAKKPLSLFRITLESSTYYATGEDSFDAYAKVVKHENDEGHHTHRGDLDFSVEVESVEVEKEDLVAWSCG
jgi:hypothetical protein